MAATKWVGGGRWPVVIPIVAAPRLRPPTVSGWHAVSGCRWSSTESSAADDVMTKLKEALKAAMRGKDKLRTNAIKSALADIQNAQKLPSPPAPIKTLRQAIARRVEAAETFRAASPPRIDLAEGYEDEVRTLSELLPGKEDTLNESQLAEAVQKVLATMEGVREEGAKAIGKVVKAVKVQVGERAEGKEIAAAVKKALSS